ncbi:MAG: S8 family serine peptidase [Cyanothece sp. SIO1E1]|nr:S8 family serine peptidase [Cyanothece sp. SIO1E1]
MLNISTLLPELPLLWAESTGDSRVCVAILDGPVDQSHLSLQEAQLTQLSTLVADAANAAGHMSGHGTHITSVIFGQHGSPVQGIAPSCRGLIVPIFSDDRRRSLSQIDLARAINQAVERGAHVISISGGELTGSGEADPILEKAVQFCNDSGVLIVAAAGNDACDCLHVPAALPSVLAIGAMNAEGVPLEFSNWGKGYQSQGILAPGENILGATPGGGTSLQQGTSFATPIVAGLVALLLSIQLKRGDTMDPHRVRQAILKSALPCPSDAVLEGHRCLAGRLNISGTYRLITSGETKAMSEQNSPLEGIQPNTVNHEGGTEGTTPAQTGPVYPVASGQMDGTQAPVHYVPVYPAPGGGYYMTPMSTSHQVVPVAAPNPASGGAQSAPVNPNNYSVNYGVPMAPPPQVVPAMAAGAVPVANGDSQQTPVNYATPIATPAQPGMNAAAANGASNGISAPSNPVITTITPSKVTASGDCGCGTAAGPLIYAIGTLGYDLMTEARRDSFKQLMPLVDASNIHNSGQITSAPTPPEVATPNRLTINSPVPGNPFDVRQLVNYLLGAPDLDINLNLQVNRSAAPGFLLRGPNSEGNISEAHALIWTLNLELTPIYALQPVGPYADLVYRELALFLEGQSLPEIDAYKAGRIDKISIPGVLTNQTVQLFSGQVVPVVQISNLRGLYGWRTEPLIDSVIAAAVPPLPPNPAPTQQQIDARNAQVAAIRFALNSFLERIYYDLRNLGQTSQDRAFNYAATNAFQFATALASILSIERPNANTSMQLDSIQVERSPFCRVDSDCWDVKLRFFDPENDRRARKILRYTIDVSDVMPVTMGQPRIWDET